MRKYVAIAQEHANGFATYTIRPARVDGVTQDKRYRPLCLTETALGRLRAIGDLHLAEAGWNQGQIDALAFVRGV